jgi:hypothetical protein
MWRPFFGYAFWRDQPGEPDEPPWRPPMSPVLFLFALVPLALADRRSAGPIVLFAVVSVALAAAQRFWPGEWRADVFLAAAALALITCPAFLLPRGDVVFLALHFAWCLLGWYALTHRLDRFLDPASPSVAVLAGMGVVLVGRGWPRRVARGVLCGGLAFSLATAVLIHAGLAGPGLARPTEEFVGAVAARSTYCQPAMEAINRRLPPDATVLFVGETRTFYCERRAIAATVFDRQPLDRMIGQALASLAPAEPVKADGRLRAAAAPPRRARRLPADVYEAIREGLAAMGVTHLYVSWPEVDRLNASYAFHLDGQQRPGFSEHVTRTLFGELIARGILRPVATFGEGLVPPFALYEVR